MSGPSSIGYPTRTKVKKSKELTEEQKKKRDKALGISGDFGEDPEKTVEEEKVKEATFVERVTTPEPKEDDDFLSDEEQDAIQDKYLAEVDAEQDAKEDKIWDAALAKEQPEEALSHIEESFTDPATRRMWQSLEKERAAGEAKIASEEQSRSQRIAIAGLMRGLLNAAALLYGAKQGVEADIKIVDPGSDAERELRRLERDIGQKRRVLQSRLSTARALFESQEGRKERKTRAEELKDIKAAERTDREERLKTKAEKDAKVKLASDEIKTREKFDKDRQRLLERSTKGLPEDPEAMLEQLKKDFPTVPEDKLKEVSGVDQGWAWFDNDPAREKIQRLYQKKAELETLQRYRSGGLPIPSHYKK